MIFKPTGGLKEDKNIANFLKDLFSSFYHV